MNVNKAKRCRPIIIGVCALWVIGALFSCSPKPFREGHSASTQTPFLAHFNLEENKASLMFLADSIEDQEQGLHNAYVKFRMTTDLHSTLQGTPLLKGTVDYTWASSSSR